MPLRVLIGDDEPDILALLDEAYRAQGFVTTLASEGAPAIAPLRESVRFDIVIFYIQMPGTDGCTVLAAARAVWPDCRVILITVYETAERRERAGGIASSASLCRRTGT